MITSILVFVVEDETLIRCLLEETLTDCGFAVSMSGTGEEAMTALDSMGADFKALITDVNLPGKISGWKVARHAREINDGLPVIYMTGASAHEWAAQGVPNSVLVTKPFVPAQIITAFTQLLNEGSATLLDGGRRWVKDGM